MMKERIRELMLEAGYAAPELAGRADKLAQLIVMECLSICEDIGDKGLDGHYCADEIGKTLLNT